MWHRFYFVSQLQVWLLVWCLWKFGTSAITNHRFKNSEHFDFFPKREVLSLTTIKCSNTKMRMMMRLVKITKMRMMMRNLMKGSVPRWKGFAGSFQNTPGNHKEHLPPIFFFRGNTWFSHTSSCHLISRERLPSDILLKFLFKYLIIVEAIQTVGRWSEENIVPSGCFSTLYWGL